MDKKPILSREQVLKIVRKTLKENNDRDKISADAFVKLEAAFEAAIIDRPIYQVWDVEKEKWLDVTHDWYLERLPSNRRVLYTLKDRQS